MDVIRALGQFPDFLPTLLDKTCSAKHPCMGLHGRTDVVGYRLRVFARRRLIELVETLEREIGGICGQRLMLPDFLYVPGDVVARFAAKHYQVQQRVRAEAVRTV